MSTHSPTKQSLFQMASTFKLLFLALFLGIVSQAYGQCKLSDISISQSATGKLAQGKPEWLVNVTNNCICTQSQVKLNCNGFQTNKQVDPSILKVDGQECLLQDGSPLYGFHSLTFNYAWDPKFSFQPISSQISCS